MKYDLGAFEAIRSLGEFVEFCYNSMLATSRLFKKRLGLFIKQVDIIGVQSIPIILISAIFIGSVLAFQLYVALHLFGAESMIGSSMGVSLGRELAPVFTAIMVAGRAGAAMCAELASMKISDQIDAMEAMSVDSLEYLITPRLFAGTISFPILNLIFFAAANIAGWIIIVAVIGLDGSAYWDKFAHTTDLIDLFHGFVKSTFFGFIVTSISCYFGYNAEGGATSVGRATNRAVVAAFLVILFSDYVITTLLPQGLSNLYVTK